MCPPLLRLLVPMAAAMQHGARARGEMFYLHQEQCQQTWLAPLVALSSLHFMHTALLLLKQGFSM